MKFPLVLLLTSKNPMDAVVSSHLLRIVGVSGGHPRMVLGHEVLLLLHRVVRVLRLHGRRLVATAPQDPRDGGDGGGGGAVAETVLDQAVADLPTEDARILLLVLLDLGLHLRSGHPWLGAANNARPDGSSLLVAVQDLADTAMTDSKLSRDDTGPDTRSGHLNDLEADVVRQRPAIDEHTAKLIHSALT